MNLLIKRDFTLSLIWTTIAAWHLLFGPEITVAQCNWINPVPQGEIISDIQFINTTTGYAIVGWHDSFLKTTDGGENWSVVETGTSSYQFSMHFTTVDTGFIAGDNGIILMTSNAGEGWTDVASPTTQALYSIDFPDSQTGFAAGASGTVVKTTDGGLNWQVLSTGLTNALLYICFKDSLTGFIGGNTSHYRTSNGGLTWVNINSLTGKYVYMAFSDSLTGYIIGDGGKIKKTTDGGFYWETIPAFTTSALRMVEIPGGDTIFVSSYTGIFRSDDAGNSWNTILQAPVYTVNEISFPTNETGFASGDNGITWKTMDAGQTWEMTNAFTGADLDIVQFTDARHGFTAGFDSLWHLFRTTDYGTHWTDISPPSTPYFTGFSFTDSLTGYVTTHSGTVIKTSDGGQNWNFLTTSITQGLHMIVFPTTETGYACGEQGTIIQTTDAGATWSLLNTGTTKAVNFISFPNEITGYGVAGSWYDYELLKTSDGGQTWNSSPLPNPDISDLLFTNASNGYVLNHDPGLLKTKDGGATWEPIYIPVFDPQAIFFTGQDTGYIAGWYGVIKTVDAGETWFGVCSAATNHFLEDIFFVDNDTGYVAGTQGLLYKITTGGLITDSGIPASGKATFSVVPNPSHGIFNLEVQDFPDVISVNVYTAAGKRVHRQTITTGNGPNQIDITGNPPGIYFIRLQGRNVVKSFKAVIH